MCCGSACSFSAAAVNGEPVGDGEEPQGLPTSHAPPVFRPLSFGLEENLAASVKKRLRKGHEPVLEEQPKWSLLARILKEIEDTIARVTETHVGGSTLLSFFLIARSEMLISSFYTTSRA